MSPSVSIVLGAQFGMEGKGMVVSSIAKKYKKPLVVRFSGGPQKTSVVKTEENMFTFSQIGSGALRGSDTYYSEYCAFDPVAFVKEFNSLPWPTSFFISPSTPLITPYEIFFDVTRASLKNDGGAGRGYYPATLTSSAGQLHICAIDLFYPRILEEKMKLLDVQYTKSSWVQEHLREFHIACNMASLIIGKNKCLTSFEMLKEAQKTYDHLIFEGSHGILLDKEHGYGRHSHIGRTTATNALNILETVSPFNYRDAHLYYVTRAYSTKHGVGPFPVGMIKFPEWCNPADKIGSTPSMGNVMYGALDIPSLDYAIRCNRSDYKRYVRPEKEHLVVTCLDHVNPSLPVIITETNSEELGTIEMIETLYSRIPDLTNVYGSFDDLDSLIVIKEPSKEVQVS